MATTTNRKYELIGENVTPDVKFWFNRLAAAIDADVQKVQTGWAADPQFISLALTAITAARKPAALLSGNIDAMPDGWHELRTPTQMAAVEGTFPLNSKGERWPGFLFQVTTSNGLKFQLYISYGLVGNVAYRTTNSVNTGSMTPWRNLWEEAPVIDPELVSPWRRAMLVDAFKRRRGTVVGTAGKPAVALRFDHGWNNFKDIVIPLLEKYDLPCLQATNSRMNTTASNVSQNTEVTLAHVQALALAHGMEVAAHGATHKDATTPEELLDEIVTGLEELKAGLPALAIEHWCPPGVGAGGYMGYSNMSTQAHHLTDAGKLVQAHHAAIGGYVPGLYRALPANMEIGMGHYTMDSASPSQVASRLNGLSVGSPSGILLMLHPALVGGSGYMTAKELDTVLADIARRRDAGELEVLTPGGLLLADHRTDYRNDLMANPTFTKGAAGWGLLEGSTWTVVTADGKNKLRSGGSTSNVTQTVDLSDRAAHARGSVREVLVKVLPEGANGTVTVTVTAGTNVVAKTFTNLDPANGEVTLRNQLVIPLTAETVTVAVRRPPSTPGITVGQISLLSV